MVRRFATTVRSQASSATKPGQNSGDTLPLSRPVLEQMIASSDRQI
ncbi:MAG TPA: hypothetical protein V6D29_13415 [Leptolyngbyaceae cyanobacterium]